MRLDKLECEKLEKMLVRTEIPFQRKTELYRNPQRIEWLHKNFKVRNSNHPRFQEIQNLLDSIVNNK